MIKSPRVPEQQIDGQLEFFGVEKSVTFGLTDPSALPHTEVKFSAAVEPIAIPAAPGTPNTIVADEGISFNVKERAKLLGELMLPLVAASGKRQALGDAMMTDRKAVITKQYGIDTPKRVRQAGENATDMDTLAWNLLYKKLGYEAAAAAGIGIPNSVKREVSDDRNKLKSEYGRGQATANNAYREVLKDQIALYDELASKK